MKLSSRINTLRALLTSAALLACSSAFAQTASLDMRSDVGDYIGQGATYSYTDGISATANSNGSVISVSVFASNGDWWFLDFAAPNGQQLHAGTYTGATRYPFQAPTSPGLDVGGQGRGCNTSNGSYTVNNITFGSYGYIVSADIDFEQHCEGAVPAIRGTLLVSNPPPPAPLEFNATADSTGDVVKLSGLATVRGTVRCSENTTAQILGTLSQRSGRKSLAQGSYSASVPCGPTATVWSANVNSQTGIPFAQGQAQNDASFQAYDPNYGGQQSKTVSNVVSLSTIKHTLTAKNGNKLRN